MFKKITGLILLGCLILILVLSIKETIENKPERIINKLPKEKWEIFDPNVELVYGAKYMNIIPVGTVSFKVKRSGEFQNKEVYHLVAHAETGSLLSFFYETKAVIQSYMDVEKLYSYRYWEEMCLPEGERRSKEILYDQEEYIAQRNGYKMKILPATQDPLSALFYLRAQRLEPEKEFSINILTDEENYEMKTNVLAKANDICHLVINVARWDRSSPHGVNFHVWMSDDERRLPLLIKAKTKAGPVTLRLVSINHKNAL